MEISMTNGTEPSDGATRGITSSCPRASRPRWATSSRRPSSTSSEFSSEISAWPIGVFG
jgi:hypothetical protein